MLQFLPKSILILTLGVFTAQITLADYGGGDATLIRVDSAEIAENFKDLVVVVDFNEIISISRSPDRISDYTPLMTFKGLWKMITLLPTLFGKFDEIKKMGMQIAQNTTGNGNIVHGLARQLKAKGYGDIASLEEDIIKLTVLDEPIADNIEVLKKLKRLGIKLVAATDQDALQYKFYKQRMARKGVDLDQLFDAVITYKSFRDIEQSDRCAIIDVGKSESGYLSVVQNLLRSKLNLDGKKIVYVDNGSLKSSKKLKNFEVIEFEDMQKLVSKIGEYVGQEVSADEFLKKPGKCVKKKGRNKRINT